MREEAKSYEEDRLNPEFKALSGRCDTCESATRIEGSPPLSVYARAAMTHTHFRIIAAAGLFSLTLRAAGAIMPKSKSLCAMLLVLANAVVCARERITVATSVGDGVVCNSLNVPQRWVVPPYDRSHIYSPTLPDYGFTLTDGGFEFRQGNRLLLGAVAHVTLEPERTKSSLYSPTSTRS
jgi:hypothetical protein